MFSSLSSEYNFVCVYSTWINSSSSFGGRNITVFSNPSYDFFHMHAHSSLPAEYLKGIPADLWGSPSTVFSSVVSWPVKCSCAGLLTVFVFSLFSSLEDVCQANCCLESLSNYKLGAVRELILFVSHILAISVGFFAWCPVSWKPLLYVFSHIMFDC